MEVYYRSQLGLLTGQFHMTIHVYEYHHHSARHIMLHVTVRAYRKKFLCFVSLDESHVSSTWELTPATMVASHLVWGLERVFLS